MKEKVCLDVESVLTDIMNPFFSKYNQLHGTDYSREDMEDWDWIPRELDINEFLDMTEEQWKQSALESIPQEEPNLSQKVASIASQRPVDIVTSRKNCDEAIQEWLDCYGIDSYQRFVSGEGDKASLGYKYYIDDNPKLANNLKDVQVLFLVSQNWNEQIDEDENIIRVKSVGDVKEELQKLVQNI